MRTICDVIIDLLRPNPPRQPLSEEDAIRALYFEGGGSSVDPGLVERLLWWEGVEPPATEMHRLRAEPLVA